MKQKIVYVPYHGQVYIPCYNCKLAGNFGTSTQGPIVWCNLDHTVHAPEVGCVQAILRENVSAKNEDNNE